MLTVNVHKHKKIYKIKSKHACNAVDKYGKKEAGTGEHLNTFNKINKTK